MVKGRILVVDDDPDICEVLRDVLEIEHYKTEVAFDGRQALEKAAARNFDVVLMDIKMPGINGVEAFKEMKKIRPEARVIMISAFAVEDLIREALREGAFAVLTKPLDTAKLIETIEAARSTGGLVLVADDDEDICTMMGRGLESAGYRVGVACSGSAAVEAVRLKNYDVVILDMKLPELNGLETYMAMRDIRPDLVVIVITGYPREMTGLACQAVENNAYIFLQKPLDMDCFLKLLGEIMTQKKEGRLEKPGR